MIIIRTEVKRLLGFLGVADFIATYWPWIAGLGGASMLLGVWGWFWGYGTPIAIMIAISVFVTLFVGMHEVVLWYRNRGIRLSFPDVTERDGMRVCAVTVERGWGMGPLESCCGIIKAVYSVKRGCAQRMYVPSTYVSWSSRTGGKKQFLDISGVADLEILYLNKGKGGMTLKINSVDDSKGKDFTFPFTDAFDYAIDVEIASKNARKRECLRLVAKGTPPVSTGKGGATLSVQDPDTGELKKLGRVAAMWTHSIEFGINDEKLEFTDPLLG